MGVDMNKVSRASNLKYLCFTISDSNLIYAMILDTLYRYNENDSEPFEILCDIIKNHETELSDRKLDGILSALNEYQIVREIPGYLTDRIVALLESRIYDNIKTDNGWILMTFKLMQTTFTKNSFKILTDLILEPNYRIDKVYFNDYLKTLDCYCKIFNTIEENYIIFVNNKLRKLETILSSISDGEYTQFLADAKSTLQLKPPIHFCDHKNNNVKLLIIEQNGKINSHISSKVKEYLRKLGIDYIELKDLSGHSNTEIESYENNDFSYVIVIFEPDNISGDADLSLQATIFQCGYYLGRISRGNIAIIKSSNVKLPDVLETFAINFENNEWTRQIAAGLRGAGFDIDLNKLARN